MLFITIFLVILAAVFIWVGARQSKNDMLIMGIVFLIAAFGGALITFFSLSTF